MAESHILIEVIVSGLCVCMRERRNSVCVNMASIVGSWLPYVTEFRLKCMLDNRVPWWINYTEEDYFLQQRHY